MKNTAKHNGLRNGGMFMKLLSKYDSRLRAQSTAKQLATCIANSNEFCCKHTFRTTKIPLSGHIKAIHDKTFTHFEILLEGEVIAWIELKDEHVVDSGRSPAVRVYAQQKHEEND